MKFVVKAQNMYTQKGWLLTAIGSLRFRETELKRGDIYKIHLFTPARVSSQMVA